MKIEKTPEMLKLASRLAWFTSPEEAIEQPQLLLTQVMTHGTVEDVLTVRQVVGLDEFRKVLDSLAQEFSTHAPGPIGTSSAAAGQPHLCLQGEYSNHRAPWLGAISQSRERCPD